MLRLAAATLALLTACGEQSDMELQGLFDEYHEDYLRENPEVATELGRTDHDTRWRDWSGPALAAWEERLRTYLARLAAFEPDSLNAQNRISLQLLQGKIESELEGLPYEAYLIRLNQLFGIHTRIFLTLREMPASTEADYRNILARLRAVPAYVDGNIETLRAGVADGIVQPALVVDHIIRQLEIQAAQAPEDSPLLAPFRSFPAGVAEPIRLELATEAERAYKEGFQPSWRKFAAFLADEYLPRARPSLGVTGLPGGDAIYQYFIRYHTSLDYSAEQIHDIGKGEVERINQAMAAIAREEGFAGGPDEYERHLMTDRRYLFGDREEMLAYHRDLAMRVEPELVRFFRKLPRHRVGIRAIPPDREAVSASNYNAPAADGSRPGWFNLKAYRPERQSRFDKPALVLHETNPGHHLQIATQLELDGLPEFRRIYHSTAYIEGWALYAESLGADLGVYDDPASRFGALESERFRARRLVVDTGLHAMGWTREQAIEYHGDASEIDRYIAWPGQALAYKMGQLKILELRSAAERAHGSEFDIRDFHDAVLGNGALPLDLLEDRVGEYIARFGGAAEGSR